MEALIVGNRPLESNVIELAKNKLVVAADAGADRLLKYNIIPDIVIGDLDSISDKTVTKLEEWIVTNKNIQNTDLEKAVDYAFEKGASKIQIVGWSGGRIDHTLTALGLAFNPKISLIDEHFTIEAVTDSKTIKGKENTLFSLIKYFFDSIEYFLKSLLNTFLGTLEKIRRSALEILTLFSLKKPRGII